MAVLRRAGLTAQMIHFGHGRESEAIALVPCFRKGAAQVHRIEPRLVVFSILFGHLLAENALLAARLRAAGMTAHMTMAGPLPALMQRDVLDAYPALDSVLLGDPESAVCQLADSLVGGVDWTSLPGLACRTHGARAGPTPAPACDLDSLPFPARDDGIPFYHGVGFTTLESSRGCYHTCALCLPCAFQRAVSRVSYRSRGIPQLVDEIEWLVRQGARLFLFDDEQFLPPEDTRVQRVDELSQELRRRQLEIAFTMKCRPDDVEVGLFHQLKEMGLIRVFLGLESGSQTTLDVLGKGLHVEQNAAALTRLDRLSVVADFRCLMFHPWSTLDTISTDLDFLERIAPWVATVLAFHEVECFPGTALHARLMKDASRRGAERSAAVPCLRKGGAATDPAVCRLSYLLADPRAEFLRRTGRSVFQCCHANQGIIPRIAQAWFDALLTQRFRPDMLAPQHILALRRIVWETNTEILAVWREMVSFAERTDFCDAEQVSRRTAGWADRLDRLDTLVRRQADRLPVPASL